MNNEKKLTAIYKTYSKQLDNLCNYNSLKEKSKQKQDEVIITYKCSRVFDNQKNLPSHEKTCKRQHKDIKKLNDRKKREHTMQLKSKYITSTSEENIVTDRLKCTTL